MPREEDARDRHPRLEDDVPELPRPLPVVGEGAEVVHAQHPLPRPEPLGARDGPAWARYVADRTRGQARTSAIDAQLDLVYEFTQAELRRRHPETQTLVLWRGQNDLAAHEIVHELGPREWVLRMNNLCSFTDDRERAWEFGDVVLEVRVAIPRVFFAGHLFPRSILKGEREFLVIGGEMRVKRILA